MTTPLHGQGRRGEVSPLAPETARRTAGRITSRFAAILLGGLCACSSAPNLDEHLAGWQGEHDAATHAFAHESFTLNRQAEVQAEKLERSGLTDWPQYAEPILRTATRSRTVHQAQGRAMVLERFLAHMRGDPGVEPTEKWFADQVQSIEAAAAASGAETSAAAAAFGSPLTMSEETFRRVVAAAAGEGRVRGEALQLADLRRTAGNYFRRLGYDERTLAFDRGGGKATAPDERLLASVDARSGWPQLRQAILQPRSCSRQASLVTCAPVPAGAPPPVVEDEPAMAPPPQRSMLPGDSIRWAEPKVRAPDLLDRRPGW